MSEQTRYPLVWPGGWKRTPVNVRKNLGPSRSMYKASAGLHRELTKLGASNVILSTNVIVRGDGLPFSHQAQPTDPGAACYFTLRGRPMCFACDTYRLVEHNVRALMLTIGAMRGIERWGASDMLERAFTGFLALPSGDKPWRSVLGFRDDERPSREQITSRFRALSKERHPDKGGSAEAFHELTVATDAALRDVGA